MRYSSGTQKSPALPRRQPACSSSTRASSSRRERSRERWRCQVDETQERPGRDRRPEPSETVQDGPGEYDALDEAVMETFPGSDPISVTDTRPLPPVGDVQE